MGLEKVIAVLVLYRCALVESEAFKTLKRAIDDLGTANLTLLVYNNSPGYWNYKSEQYKNLNIIYIEDEHNSGVGKAYNTALVFARKSSKDYLLLLDQDTTLSQSFFKVLLDCQQSFKEENIGLYCPLIYNHNGLLSPARFFLFSTKKIVSMAEGIHKLKGLAIINSGLVVSTKLFDSVGGYNEQIKLDFSDFDFLKRCLKFCDKIIVFNATCYHSLSSENAITKADAVNRFGYYIEGAAFFHKSRLEGIVLTLWVFLRSLKLNYRYNTLDFTKRLLLHK